MVGTGRSRAGPTSADYIAFRPFAQPARTLVAVTTYDRKLTHHATTTASTTDTVTLTGNDRPASAGTDPPYSTTSATGAAAIAGGLIYNEGPMDLYYTVGSTAQADPATQSNEGVRRLPPGCTNQFTETWQQAVVKVWSSAAVSYSIEVNAA